MIMLNEYLFELKEFLREEPDSTFEAAGKTREEIMADDDTMDSLWTIFQKNVEEYDCEPQWSFYDAMVNVLGIRNPSWAY